MTIEAQIAKYRWYHSIEVTHGQFTPGDKFDLIWSFIKDNIKNVAFSGMTVLDVGCRDGLFSLYAERQGAAEITGIDNNLSEGAVEFLLPYLQSKVRMFERNLVASELSDLGVFDIVMMFGVLYHLRYPMFGLRRVVTLTKDDGIILIETAVFRGLPQHLPILFCPWKEQQPYEPGSVSFFNALGLVTCMESLGCVCERRADLDGSDSGPNTDFNVRRGFFQFRKIGEMTKYLEDYWDGTHHEHSQ